MTLMTKEVKNILFTPPPVKGFAFQPVEYQNWISIRLFRDNFASFNAQEQQLISNWLVEKLLKPINRLGIPCYLEQWDTFGGREI